MGAGEGARAPVEELQTLLLGACERRNQFQELHTRPAHITDKTGQSGRPLPLISNYFMLEQAPDWHLYQYRVDFKPEIDSKKMRLALLFSHEELIGQTRAFDGFTLFLPKRLQKEVTEVYSQRTTDDTTIQITIRLTNELPRSSPTNLQVYNIMYRRVLAMIDMKQIGRHYYNPSLAAQIPQHKLQVIPGFITSILQYETNVLLSCDISHKILRTDTVLDIMYEMYDKNRHSFKDDVEKKFTGSIVLTRYNNKTYRVDDLDWAKRPSDTFKLRNGTEVTYKEYYQKSYGITVTDEEQPMLVSKLKKKDLRRQDLEYGSRENGHAEKGGMGYIYLIPELCTLTGLSDDAHADFQVMKDVAVHTRIAPAGRQKTLLDFVQQINRNQEVQQEMGGWGVRFSNKLVDINARVMPQERINQKGGQLSYKQEDADWSRDMRGKQLVTAVGLHTWLVIFFKRNAPQAQDFVQTLFRVGPPMGMNIQMPTVVELPEDRTELYLTAIKAKLKAQTQLVMCIVPSNKKDRYDAIKKLTCVDHPVPSQVIVQRTLSKKQMMMSVATKVAIQLNCKLGGEVWSVEIPLKSLMVIGIDSYHDSRKGRSVGGFVASMNRDLTRYYSRTACHTPNQELFDGLKLCFRGALKKFHETNNCLPERIVVYRDGVGDGQLEAVYEHEVKQILDYLKQAGGQDYNPKVAVIVVKKRINSRFFARAGNSLCNPPPGTVIDNTVTKPEWYDFFIVSQSVRQGTVTPTHYNIIYDTLCFKPDHMQRLTYKLCHLYYNWPGTIRVPAPCQYAHKLAFLVGQSLHRDPALELSDRLYFL